MYTESSKRKKKERRKRVWERSNRILYWSGE